MQRGSDLRRARVAGDTLARHQSGRFRNDEGMKARHTSDIVRDRLGELFSEAERLGLRYPYGALSLVETPANLRLYTGGWRMDTAQAMPGVLILLADPSDKAMAERKAEMLVSHFENDFSGGNPFSGAARNFILYQRRLPKPCSMQWAARRRPRCFRGCWTSIEAHATTIATCCKPRRRSASISTLCSAIGCSIRHYPVSYLLRLHRTGLPTTWKAIHAIKRWYPSTTASWFPGSYDCSTTGVTRQPP